MGVSFPFVSFCGGAGLLTSLAWIIWLHKKLKVAHNREIDLNYQLQQTLFDKEKLMLELKHQIDHFEERLASVHHTRATLEDHLKALCTDVLQHSQKTFLGQAESLLKQLQHITRGELGQQHEKLNFLITPVANALATIDEKIQTLEKSRVGAYEALTQQLSTLNSTHKDLYQQTHQLVQALRTPHVRGRWGEIQLRRLVELAGMIPHCDFLEQTSLVTQDADRLLRPDLIITLPGHRKIVIDAKVPLLSYMNGIEAADTSLHKKNMKDHARQMRGHIKSLSQKAYWAQFTPSPEFVLLFLPSENLLTAALEEDKDILDYGAESRVLIATPMTLLALLKTIALGWHQHSFNENAEKISLLGRDIHRKLNDMMGSFSKIGQHLGLTLSHYQNTLVVWEEKVLPSTQELGRLTEIGGTSLQKESHSPLLSKVSSQRLRPPVDASRYEAPQTEANAR